jgi:uncharacterized oxidoreductase
MKTSGNTILITGGATGIGLALAKAFVKAGNEVIICGRREHKLLDAQKKLPGITIIECDVSQETERQKLYEWTITNFKSTNILVNNAGIQREVNFRDGARSLSDNAEIAINLIAPIHLSALLIPHLMNQPEAAIINISSGLAFVPLAVVPVYCATKAALHSLSLSLRHQLKDSSVKVFEVLPPTVESELHDYAKSERRRFIKGISPDIVAEATLAGLTKDQFEIAVGGAKRLRLMSRLAPSSIFNKMNAR